MNPTITFTAFKACLHTTRALLTTAACALFFSVIVPTLSVFAQDKQGALPQTSATQTMQSAPSKVGAVGATTARSYRVSSRPTRGVVVNLVDFLATGDGAVNAAQATEAAQKGAILALRVGAGRSAKIFLVAKADGSSAATELARLADGNVGVVGKTATRAGMSVIMADVIDAMK
jgi:hypothetical protein